MNESTDLYTLYIHTLYTTFTSRNRPGTYSCQSEKVCMTLMGTLPVPVATASSRGGGGSYKSHLSSFITNQPTKVTSFLLHSVASTTAFSNACI